MAQIGKKRYTNSKIRSGKGSKIERDLFEYEYDEEITYECPVRGTVTQIVCIRKFRPRFNYGFFNIVGSSDELDNAVNAVPSSSEEED